MRIMIDTNILLSALVFGSAKMASLLEEVTEIHTLVICSFVIDEFRIVFT
jgi:predicted nucleic acid-binding protein